MDIFLRVTRTRTRTCRRSCRPLRRRARCIGMRWIRAWKNIWWGGRSGPCSENTMAAPKSARRCPVPWSASVGGLRERNGPETLIGEEQRGLFHPVFQDVRHPERPGKTFEDPSNQLPVLRIVQGPPLMRQILLAGDVSQSEPAAAGDVRRDMLSVIRRRRLPPCRFKRPKTENLCVQAVRIRRRNRV